jgi:hypothetical protein
MITEYEKQLEEANQRLREQLEKETARADRLEKKIEANKWRGLVNPEEKPNESPWINRCINVIFPL